MLAREYGVVALKYMYNVNDLKQTYSNPNVLHFITLLLHITAHK